MDEALVDFPGAIVVLIGAPGAGKTRTGRRLARMLDVPFIDTDKRVVAQHGSVAAIFEQHGEARFRALEREAVVEALAQRAVVTLGGGAVLDPRTQADLAECTVVQLRVSADAVAARIAGGKRPLLVGGIESWERLVSARQPIYDRLSAVTIDTSGRQMEAIALEVVEWLSSGRTSRAQA